MSEHLDKLDKLTPHLDDLVSCDRGGVVEYAEGQNNMLGFGLFKTEQVAVQRVFMSAGSEFPEHLHEGAREWLIVYHGALSLTRGGETRLLRPADSVILEPDEPHSAVAVEDCWMVAVSVPPDRGYPDAKPDI